jgi:hypothetical protein
MPRIVVIYHQDRRKKRIDWNPHNHHKNAIPSTPTSARLITYITPPKPPHVHIDFVVPLPGSGWSVNDVWGWGAYRAQLCCLDSVNDDTYKRGVPEAALIYRLPRPWSLWGSYPARENSHSTTGNRTRDLMASSQKFWPPSQETGHVHKCSYCNTVHNSLDCWYRNDIT